MERPRRDIEIARCGAPAGGCGFRGRDWRKGQLVASYSPHDGTPHCACGSEMRPFEPRRFVTAAGQEQGSPDAET